MDRRPVKTAHTFCTHSPPVLLSTSYYCGLGNENGGRMSQLPPEQKAHCQPCGGLIIHSTQTSASLMKSWLPHARTILQYKENFQLVKRGMAENGSFVGVKYPIQSAGRMAKNGCDSFDFGPYIFNETIFFLKKCKLKVEKTRNVNWK